MDFFSPKFLDLLCNKRVYYCQHTSSILKYFLIQNSRVTRKKQLEWTKSTVYVSLVIDCQSTRSIFYLPLFTLKSALGSRSSTSGLFFLYQSNKIIIIHPYVVNKLFVTISVYTSVYICIFYLLGLSVCTNTLSMH